MEHSEETIVIKTVNILFHMFLIVHFNKNLKI